MLEHLLHGHSKCKLQELSLFFQSGSKNISLKYRVEEMGSVKSIIGKISIL